MNTHNTDGPIVVWTDYGLEGWQPQSYPTVLAALQEPHHTRFVITQRIDLAEIIKEPETPPRCQHCGKPFIGRRADAAFCSNRCKTANHRKTAEKPVDGSDGRPGFPDTPADTVSR